MKSYIEYLKRNFHFVCCVFIVAARVDKSGTAYFGKNPVKREHFVLKENERNTPLIFSSAINTKY